MRLMALVVFLAVRSHSQVLVTTYRNNLARSGENLQETILTPSNVAPAQFGKLFSQPVDGQVYAQPLYMPSVSVPGKGIHNMIFVVTAHDTVYAFDADSSAAPLWRVSLATAPGERPLNVSDVLGCNSMTPEIGITGTPVIDSAAGTLYVVAVTILNGSFVHRLHALDITTGAEKPGSPVVISASVTVPGQSTVTFDPTWQLQRAGLLLYNGVVYIAFASYCDQQDWRGWIIGYSYNGSSFSRAFVFSDEPSSVNGRQAGIWMAGQGLSMDTGSNMFVATGNGRTFLTTWSS